MRRRLFGFMMATVAALGAIVATPNLAIAGPSTAVTPQSDDPGDDDIGICLILCVGVDD